MKKEKCGCVVRNGIHHRLGSKETPEWTEAELAMCDKYDKLVAEGKMTWRTIK